jgi:3'(2'), 5'-bisphosphate nucleotidase
VRLASSVETAHSASDEVERALAQISAVESVRIDSQAKYGLVARGSADAYIRRSPTATYVEHIWDHAAGALVAQEAGCTVTDLRGQPLDFSQGRGLSSNEGIVCATPALHARALRALQPAFR